MRVTARVIGSLDTLTSLPWKTHMPDRWPGRPALTRASPGLFQGLPICPSHPSPLSVFTSVSPCVCVSVFLCVGFRRTSCPPGHRTRPQAGRRPKCSGQKREAARLVRIFKSWRGSDLRLLESPQRYSFDHIALQDFDFCSHSVRLVERLLVRPQTVPSRAVLF